jgi:hypothetical protein
MLYIGTNVRKMPTMQELFSLCIESIKNCIEIITKNLASDLFSA